MYRTLIVDDELLMRQYLGSNLSLICPDFCVTGIAEDGLAAVELLNKQSFDLVITDIKMPEIDGLMLTKLIADKTPDTRIIIISGYNEFDYARTAIKYGVSDYLLKPVSDDNIRETLVKIKNELDIANARKDSLASAQNYNQYSDNELKSLLLSNAINESAYVQPLYNALYTRKISFLQSCSSVLLLCLDELHLMLQEKRVSENTAYQLELNQICEAYCDLHHYAITYDDHGYTLILLTTDFAEEIPTIANMVYNEISKRWNRKQLKIISSFGAIAKNIVELSASYLSAVRALALSLKNVPSPITSNYYISQSKFLNELNTICDALSTDYISKNKDKTRSDLYRYLNLFDKEINIASILRYGSWLIRYLAYKCNIKTDYLLIAFKKLTNGIDEKLSANHFCKEQIHELFMQVIIALAQDDLFRLIPENPNVAESAKEYICTHYQEQISLAMVADYLNMNPSYLSDLFHKSMGESYTKFLTRVRMEQALLLLKSNPNEKIYVIAEKTGFVSPKHFNNVFKKYYGFTPTEYIARKNNL